MGEGSTPDIEVLKKLEGRIDDLIALCRRLQEDNVRWRARHQTLSAEHARLNERTRAARARVEEMIGRVATLTRESR